MVDTEDPQLMDNSYTLNSLVTLNPLVCILPMLCKLKFQVYIDSSVAKLYYSTKMYGYKRLNKLPVSGK